MKARFFRWAATALTATLMASAGTAVAERVRYHFTPVDLCGTTVQTPAGKYNSIGERVSYLGLPNRPYNCPMVPTQIVTFCHPYAQRTVSVPMAMPPGTARISRGRDRIVFHYTSYSVEARFWPDGSVDTVYDSGIFRPLR
jgi:hypothetical protein